MNQHKRLRPGPPLDEREPGRKARQLSRQVAETLDAVLSGESGDDLLRNLRIVSVVPAPDASRLLVTLRILPSLEVSDPNVVLARLEKAAGWLRTEAASAVTRKRAPALVFRVLAGEEAPAEPSDRGTL
jgi:ribosome-binding factor A